MKDLKNEEDFIRLNFQGIYYLPLLRMFCLNIA
jgi:hypothetical protein